MNKIHNHLLRKYQFYAFWHAHPLHLHAHWTSLVMVAVVTSLFLQGVIYQNYTPLVAEAAAQDTTLMAGHFMTPFDKIPDFGASPTVTTVKSGSWTDASVWSTGVVPGANDVALIKHAVTYNSTNGNVKTIAVDGGASFTCATNQSTRLSVGTFQIKPTGKLECVVPSQFTGEIVIRDLPLNTVADPSQYGNGILAIDAAIKLQGAAITETFIRLSAEPLSGSRTITLSQSPSGWKAGDEIFLPDTRQLTSAEYTPRPHFDFDSISRSQSQSEKAIIQSISGSTITLTAPLQFNHKGARNPEGVVEILPHVGNLSRNLVIRSENPNGTRGHIFLTRTSDIDVRYVQIKNMGRTLADPLNVTTFDSSGNPTHIGTNQIGRYPLHIHHVPGVCPAKDYQFKIIGNSIEDGRKWAMTIHGSHYGLIKDNVIFYAKGAGIATEDGSETGNVFDHNFIVNVENATLLTSVDDAVGGGTDPAGRLGNGFWFRGPNHVLINNVVADTREGIGYYSGASESPPSFANIFVRQPLFPCADTRIDGQYSTQVLYRVYNLEVNNNEIYSPSEIGLGTWFYEQALPETRIPIKNTIIWHAASTAVKHKYWNGTLDGLKILNEGGLGVGIQQFNNNVTGLAPMSEVRNASIVGVDMVYQVIGQLGLQPSYLFEDSTFRSRSGITLGSRGQNNSSPFPPVGSATYTFRNVKFQALPGLPLVAIKLTEGGGDLNNYLKNFSFYNYQGNGGDNFRLYFASQLPGAPGPGPGVEGGGCNAGLTNQQCFDRGQSPMYQAIAPCSTTRAEFFGGVVCPISATPSTYSTPYSTPYATPYSTPAYGTPYSTPYATPYPTPTSSYATPASTPLTITGDLNKDGIVNSLDWSIMNIRWFSNNAEADLNHDGIVNTIDFSILNSNWLRNH